MPADRMVTIELRREKPDDGQRYCDLCGVLLSEETLEAQRQTLVGAFLKVDHLATRLIAEEVIKCVSAPFRRGEDWCYLCAYGADLVGRSVIHSPL